MALPKSWLVLAFVIYLACLFCRKACGNTVETTVHIQGQKSIATTDENFICATLDWYPPDQCDYGTCSWGHSSVLNMDLNNVVFLNAIKAFSPLVIRIGGSLADRVIYQTENQRQPCVPFIANSSALFQFNEACLPFARWDQLNHFFAEGRALVVFTLNALSGKLVLPNNTAVGPWDFGNAESLMRYTVKKDYKIYGWELGNELSGRGMPIGTNADRYAIDTIDLRNIVHTLYKGISPKPYIIGPAGFLDPVWFRRYIYKANGALDVVTQHIYNLGKGDDKNLVGRILDPFVLEGGVGVFRDLDEIIRDSRRKLVAWVGESGGVMHGGRDGVTNRFLFGFWYLDQLGMASIYSTKKYCRQSLVGGNYGLLDTTTYAPNPDYYSALLWHRLMGTKVLLTNFIGTRKIRSYAHCGKQSRGVTLLLVNIEGTTTVRANPRFNIAMALYANGSNELPSLDRKHYSGQREEYHLIPLNGDVLSQKVLLNGKPLAVDSSGAIPALKPVSVNSAAPIKVAPYSIVFVHMPYATVPACANPVKEESLNWT